MALVKYMENTQFLSFIVNKFWSYKTTGLDIGHDADVAGHWLPRRQGQVRQGQAEGKGGRGKPANEQRGLPERKGRIPERESGKGRRRV